MNQRQDVAPQMPTKTDNENDRTAFSEIMDKPEFAEFEEISKILQLMNSLDTNTRPRYRTYVAGNTAS